MIEKFDYDQNGNRITVKVPENNIVFGREKASGFFHRIASAVSLSLGAAGSNAVIQTSLPPYYLVTNDAGTIVDEAHSEDEFEELGANMAREMTKNATDKSGDGRKTTIVIGDAILELGKEYSGMEIKNSLDECLPIIIKSIDDQKKTITTDEEVKAVATISCESPEMGAMIADIYSKIGKDGGIEIDNSRTYETYYEIKEGLNFLMAGIVSKDFATDGEKAEYEKPTILVTNQIISVEGDILPLAQLVQKDGRNNLTIVCNRIDTGALGFLVRNKLAGLFNFNVIKAPTIMNEMFFEDFAAATGAKFIGEKSGLTLKTATLEHLGTCEKLIATKDETRLIGTKDLSEHIGMLQKEHQTGILKERIRRLNTKMAVLYVFANSETDLKYRKTKAEDAVNATKLALKDGIVAGGGVALLNAITSLPDTHGGNILRDALKAPINHIARNAGWNENHDHDFSEAFMGFETMHGLSEQIGYNAKTKQIVNMFDSNIIDSSMVTKNSVTAAISIAGTFLSTKVLLANKKAESVPQMPFPMM